jgi:selenocysteine-specific elongation factor
VRKDAIYERVADILVKTFEKAGYDFVWYSEMDFGDVPGETADDILTILLEEGQVVKVTDDMYTLKKYMDDARAVILDELKKNPVITIAQVRDLFGTSRKSAKPILEYMDGIKVTKKTGAESERAAYK